ncbi:MAG: chemotaxis response regulator protein-glutamate methylesterase [Pseudomonadota bacterium]
MPIRVLIVDDSKAIGAFLTAVLSADPEIEVLGQAFDPFEARNLIKELSPDVITLDVEMPRMDGITFLRNLMRLRPMPVLMLSSLTSEGAEVTLDALAAGAVDFMVKRNPKTAEEREQYQTDIIDRVKTAASAQVAAAPVAAQPSPKGATQENRGPSGSSAPELNDWRATLRTASTASSRAHRVLVLGASTGGTEALRIVLSALEVDGTAVLLAQHMPERFMAPFAERLNRCTGYATREGKHLESLEAGRVYVAPGDQHMTLKRVDQNLMVKLDSGPNVEGHRPSVDKLFHSVAAAAGPSAVGVLLTGMGKDGAAGLLAMRQAGAITLVQDERTSAVWGMPGAAAKMGAAMAALPLLSVAPTLNRLLKGSTVAAAS